MLAPTHLQSLVPALRLASGGGEHCFCTHSIHGCNQRSDLIPIGLRAYPARSALAGRCRAIQSAQSVHPNGSAKIPNGNTSGASLSPVPDSAGVRAAGAGAPHAFAIPSRSVVIVVFFDFTAIAISTSGTLGTGGAVYNAVPVGNTARLPLQSTDTRRSSPLRRPPAQTPARPPALQQGGHLHRAFFCVKSIRLCHVDKINRTLFLFWCHS